jgi:hypothetical protein
MSNILLHYKFNITKNTIIYNIHIKIKKENHNIYISNNYFQFNLYNTPS